MAQCLRILVALPEDLSSFPRTRVRQHTIAYNYSSQGIQHL